MLPSEIKTGLDLNLSCKFAILQPEALDRIKEAKQPYGISEMTIAEF